MPLEVMARKSKLPAAKGRFYMRTTRMDTVKEQTVFERSSLLLGKYKDAEVESIIRTYFKVVIEFALEGRNVKTPLGVIRLTAKGSLESEDESYMPHINGKHEIMITLKPGKALLRDIATRAIVERVKWHDLATPVVETAITKLTKSPLLASKDDVVIISGLKLGFDASDEAQGVFFKNGTKIRIAKYLSIGKNAIEIQLPSDIPQGSYTITVATALNSPELREGSLVSPFVVV